MTGRIQNGYEANLFLNAGVTKSMTTLSTSIHLLVRRCLRSGPTPRRPPELPSLL